MAKIQKGEKIHPLDGVEEIETRGEFDWETSLIQRYNRLAKFKKEEMSENEWNELQKLKKALEALEIK